MDVPESSKETFSKFPKIMFVRELHIEFIKENKNLTTQLNGKMIK